MEAILDDPLATHADRLRADERLAELERAEASATVTERLTPEQVAEELESLAAAVPAMLAVARGPESVEPPVEDGELDELLELADRVTAEQERRIFELECALQREHVNRQLPPAGALP